MGKWAEKYPQLVEKIYNGGHLLANHGYSDPYMSKISDEEITAEIRKTNEIIYNITGYKPVYFSPPYGEKDNRIFERSFKDGMTNVLWSLDTIDWMRPGSEKMANRVLDNLHKGAMILMHNTEQTPNGLRLIIAGIKERGYRIVTVKELLDADYFKNNIKQKIMITQTEN